MDIYFEIGGKRIPLDQAEETFGRALVEAVTTKIRNKTTGIRCLIHHREPTVRVVGDTLELIEFDASACCEDIAREVRDRLKLG